MKLPIFGVGNVGRVRAAPGAETLGHSVTITLDLSSHVTPTMQQQAVSVLDSRLSAPVAVDLTVNGDP